MITLQDCFSQVDARPDEILVVARHRRIPAILAVGQVEALLAQPWGGAAICQMILDEHTRAGAQGDVERAEALTVQYDEAHELYVGGSDRRRLPR
ncbi:hypothetical protein F1188_05590 [Roseospira marina]|uniref:Uncharacterized protein n=1 Tax=Roseospira marina TaxID=140057 RepID=A0A5M6IE43_9PROT|nr:hypothetical protein [Roseospira marina]KAA5606352.1 hypothetical protein F1188_05590 [Roseospira marina]MBB4314249.1 hypothetical protein [Roseospira marina]MBB5087409.1 hypothetical protein [Roseospira marina]